MKIDGRLLSAEILGKLKKEIKSLKFSVPPHLAVIWVGSDSSSLSFIRQKQLAAKQIGAKISLIHFRKTPEYTKIARILLQIATDKSIHGMIIQRPFPPTLSADTLNVRIPIFKDVDGFLPKSAFDPPVGMAVFKILSEVYYRHLTHIQKPIDDYPKSLISYLKNKKIVQIGRGETAGKPIAQILNTMKLNFIILNSQSQNRDEYLNQADIVISAVGKSQIITPDQVKPNCILIGVGIHKEKGKLTGDFDENEFKDQVLFYTPTPGGVGPVNVACLMQNLVSACKLQLK